MFYVLNLHFINEMLIQSFLDRVEVHKGRNHVSLVHYYVCNIVSLI